MTQREQAEFEKVYHDLLPKVRNFAVRLCRNRDEADDLAQEAFLKALHAFDRRDDHRKIDNWLMRIVYNTFLDHVRMQGRRIRECRAEQAAPNTTMEDFADPRWNPEEILLGEPVSNQLLSALSTLDADSRDLIQKVYFERQGQQELSEEYGIRIGALRSRIHRITHKLRNELSANSPITSN